MLYLFKQAAKFEFNGKPKFFSLGTHTVPSEISSQPYFLALQKDGSIIEVKDEVKTLSPVEQKKASIAAHQERVFGDKAKDEAAPQPQKAQSPKGKSKG